MGRRNHKYIINILLATFWMGLTGLWVCGCTDNPEAEAAKKTRSQTEQAVKSSVTEKDYDAAQRKVAASLQQNRPQGLTKDVALLASGNLALAKGQQMQMDLAPKGLQLRGSANKLEEILRISEGLLLEKEKIEMFLAAGGQEIVELQRLLDGDDQAEGLKKKLDQVDVQRQQMLSEKETLQSEKDQVQSILDELQSNADSLKRKAELAKGDTRLDLEKQAFAILHQRKEHYVKAQALENQISVIDDEIALIQVRFDGLTQNIQQVQQRIEAINNSQTRLELKQQLRDVDESIAKNRKDLTATSGEIASIFAEYGKALEEIRAVYQEAIDEFEKIRSGDAEFAATVHLADGAYYAALSHFTLIRTQRDLSERLQGVLDTSDSVFVSAIQSNISITPNVHEDYKKKTFDYFDRSIEAYDEAYFRASRMGTEAKCSVLKSKLLALYSKMQLADLIGEYDLAGETEAAMEELKKEGVELGVCFTQSEAMRLIANEGIDYLPSIPLNMEVFIESLKRELSAWKQLPVSGQEAAIEKNLQRIDALVSKYGQDVARQLDTLKQEMLSAKERGFEESTSEDSGVGGPM